MWVGFWDWLVFIALRWVRWVGLVTFRRTTEGAGRGGWVLVSFRRP